MRKIKKFEPLSVMRVSAICYGVLGLLEGAIFAVIFSMAPLGAIMGGLSAVVYNVTAGYVGGIEVDVE